MDILQSTIDVETRFSKPAQYTLLSHVAGTRRLVVLFPGSTYSVDAPLLWYARKTAALSGCDVLSVEYGYQANQAEFDMADRSALSAEVVSGLNAARADVYSHILFISKSLGTIVAGDVEQRWKPAVQGHIFLTPLPQALGHMKACKRALVQVGDKDSRFGPEYMAEARAIPHVQLHVVQGVGYSLEREDSVEESLAILQGLSSQWQSFLK